MNAVAVILEKPEEMRLSSVALATAGAQDVVVDITWSGISTGTEKLLWSGRMPHFPGMGYPLIPGYESVGRVVEAGVESGRSIGETVFVPGATWTGPIRGLFGGAASRVVVPGARVTRIDESLGERGVLLALAATAHHALAKGLPNLVIGHGVLGRLIARIAVALGGSPIVLETNPQRSAGALGYTVVTPDDEPRRDFTRILDASGDAGLLDTLISRLAKGGEIILAGFYDQPLAFAFPAAFMREATIRIAAEWKPADLLAVQTLLASGALSLDGLVTHRSPAMDAANAYRTAFGDPSCLKMVLDWSAAA